MEKPDAGGGKLHVLKKNENSSTDKRKTIMTLIVYNRENSRPQEVIYKGKKDCFARFYCSGGCAANGYHFGGDIRGNYKIGCELQRKRVECAIMIKAALAE